MLLLPCRSFRAAWPLSLAARALTFLLAPCQDLLLQINRQELRGARSKEDMAALFRGPNGTQVELRFSAENRTQTPHQRHQPPGEEAVSVEIFTRICP